MITKTADGRSADRDGGAGLGAGAARVAATCGRCGAGPGPARPRPRSRRPSRPRPPRRRSHPRPTRRTPRRSSVRLVARGIAASSSSPAASSDRAASVIRARGVRRREFGSRRQTASCRHPTLRLRSAFAGRGRRRRSSAPRQADRARSSVSVSPQSLRRRPSGPPGRSVPKDVTRRGPREPAVRPARPRTSPARRSRHRPTPNALTSKPLTAIAHRQRREHEREPDPDHPADHVAGCPLLEQRLARDDEDHVRDAGPDRQARGRPRRCRSAPSPTTHAP